MNTDKNKLIILLALFMSTLIVYSSSQDKTVKKEQVYPYYFMECTGSNQYIIINKSKIFFNFDNNRSDHEAFSSFMRLKWEVLYPNAEGEIKITGVLDERKKIFILKKWVIGSPFEVWNHKEEETLHTEITPIFEKKLKCSHFKKECPKDLDTHIYVLPKEERRSVFLYDRIQEEVQ